MLSYFSSVDKAYNGITTAIQHKDVMMMMNMLRIGGC